MEEFMVENEEERRELLSFYRSVLKMELLPFWERAVDLVHGGVYTCFDNQGERLLYTDKYTWSQGRFLWLWSRLAEMCDSKLIECDKEHYLNQAEQTYAFLRQHTLL